MTHFPTFFTNLLALLLFAHSCTSRISPEKVPLSSVKALTLRKDLLTTHRRVSAIPQLRCVGGDAKGFYDIDVLRCKNQGSSYGDEDVQWTCSASLPSEFKLGSTDVICEGFQSSDDPYVLKGSCGVEYRLMLTDLGQEKYGHETKGSPVTEGGGHIVATLFWVVFIVVLCWIVYAAFFGYQRPPGLGQDRPGFFGGGGDDNDPPPPYDHHSAPKAYSSRAMPRAAPARGQEGWRPGFWTGALGGAAAGYAAGNRGQSQRYRDYGPNVNYGGNGEGSSRMGTGGRTGSSSSVGSSSYGSSRHESSGFGGTSRR